MGVEFFWGVSLGGFGVLDRIWNFFCFAVVDWDTYMDHRFFFQLSFIVAVEWLVYSCGIGLLWNAFCWHHGMWMDGVALQIGYGASFVGGEMY